MKKLILCLCFCLLFTVSAGAFLYEIKIPAKEEVAALSDKQLLDLYVDVVVERKASETFHARAGFTPNEYKKFKDLLKLIITLRMEMLKRNVETPPIEEWLN